MGETQQRRVGSSLRMGGGRTRRVDTAVVSSAPGGQPTTVHGKIDALLAKVPPFRPHPLLPGPHWQTVAGMYLPFRAAPYRAHCHFVELDDGDQIAVHEDLPDEGPASRIVLLIHGLGGCYASPYVQRVAARLSAVGIGVARMDQRGCGAGRRVARHTCHAGRSDDVEAVVRFLSARHPQARLMLCGFSLGGNLVLRWLGTASRDALQSVDFAMAVAPPIQLADCVASLGRGINRVYDHFFTRRLWHDYQVRTREGRHVLAGSGGRTSGGPSQSPNAGPESEMRTPKNLYELDQILTAPLGGFASAQTYYEFASSLPYLAKVSVDTLIIAAEDDPMIPAQMFARAALSPQVRLYMTRSGGHMGYVASRCEPDRTGHGQTGGRRWLDRRIVDCALSLDSD